MNEPFLLVCIGATVMALAMWGMQPSGGCVLATDARAQLFLDRTMDVEHLRGDGRKIARVANAYARRRDARPDDGPWCETQLTRQVAERHGVPVGAIIVR